MAIAAASLLCAMLAAEACGTPVEPTPSIGQTAGATPTASSGSPSPTQPPTPPEPSGQPSLPSAVPSVPPIGDPCGPSGIFCGPYGFSPTYGLPYTNTLDCGTLGACQLSVDVYQPAVRADSPPPPTGGWPLVVAIPGGPLPPGAREGLSTLGAALAVRGVVAILADWREAPSFGGGYPTSFEDVACAIRFARENAEAYGANAGRVVLAAHSFGGFAGAVVTLSPKTIPPTPGGCLATQGSPRPDAYVGIAPTSTLDGVSAEFLEVFFGGTRDEKPEAWAAADPLVLAVSATKYPVPVVLLTGAADATVPTLTVEPLRAALESADRDVQMTELVGATHTEILGRPETIAAVLEVATP